ncbi:hypothetical protein [Actinotalea ferrariae]|nr:hypothetical protein [Actinotalea ferrariae]
MPTTTAPRSRLERLADRHPLALGVALLTAPLWSVFVLGGDVR